MPLRIVDGVPVWGAPDAATLNQMRTCLRRPAVAGALMADAHKGYSQPIGGVVAYTDHVSPSGVGFDIGCGNLAARTDLRVADLRPDLPRLMDAIFRTISFGVGRRNPAPVDHPLFADPTWHDVPELAALLPLARAQLGTVGAGNHYVDLFEEPATGLLWVGVHFGSRGFGHMTATGFLNLAAGRPFDAPGAGESMDMPPTLLPLRSERGQAYLAAMALAGRYAYAGREHVVGQVLALLGARATFAVHNHHNYAWAEEHQGRRLLVVRKGATPLAPGQLGFVGGSMGDLAVVIRGRDTEAARLALFSGIHGAGRIMSRTQAAGKWQKVHGRRVRVGGSVSPEMLREAVRRAGVELRGGGTDEAPQVYRPLQQVLDAHADTLEVVHVLRPVGVAMAEADEFDPYRD